MHSKGFWGSIPSRIVLYYKRKGLSTINACSVNQPPKVLPFHTISGHHICTFGSERMSKGIITSITCSPLPSLDRNSIDNFSEHFSLS